MLADLEDTTQYPFFLLAVQCPNNNSKWHHQDRRLTDKKGLPRAEPMNVVMKIYDQLAQEYPIDQDRVFVASLSSAATECWEFIQRYGNRLSAAVLFAPGRGLIDRMENVCNLPIWVFHTDKDPVTPAEPSAKTVDQINAQGGQAAQTVISTPKPSHNSWKPAFADHDLKNWLMSQRRGQIAMPPGTYSWAWHRQHLMQYVRQWIVQWKWWQLLAQFGMPLVIAIVGYSEFRRRKKQNQIMQTAMKILCFLLCNICFTRAEALGQFVMPSRTTASSYYPDFGPEALLDEPGISQSTLLGTSKWGEGTWIGGVAQKGAAQGSGKLAPQVAGSYLIFHFTQPVDLSDILVWQSNRKAFDQLKSHLGRQVATFNLAVSSTTAGDDFSQVNAQPLKLLQVPGTGKIACETFALTAEKVQRVKLEILSSHSGRKSDYLGLSEIRFVGTKRWDELLAGDLGDLLVADQVTASSHFPKFGPDNLFDVPEVAPTTLVEPSRWGKGMWIAGVAEADAATGSGKLPAKVLGSALDFHFNVPVDLSRILIWQGNRLKRDEGNSHLRRQVATFDLWVSSEDAGEDFSKLNKHPLRLAKVPGTGRIAAEIFQLVAPKARRVRLSILAAHSGRAKEFLGLSEIRFVGTKRWDEVQQSRAAAATMLPDRYRYSGSDADTLFSPNGVTATSHHPKHPPETLIDQVDLVGAIYQSTKHSRSDTAKGMWLTGVDKQGTAQGMGKMPADVSGTDLVFHFKQPTDLSKIYIWQFNQHAKQPNPIESSATVEQASPSSGVLLPILGRQVAKFDLYVSPKTSGDDYYKINEEPFNLSPVTGKTGVSSQSFDLQSLAVHRVKLDVRAAHSKKPLEHVGLSEVMFEGTLPRSIWDGTTIYLVLVVLLLLAAFVAVYFYFTKVRWPAKFQATAVSEAN